jgi:hypothetical protein
VLPSPGLFLQLDPNIEKVRPIEKEVSANFGGKTGFSSEYQKKKSCFFNVP